MKHDPVKTCRQCGTCCHVDMFAYVVESDIERWKRENRFDILSHIHNDSIIWSGDIMVTADGRHLSSCVFLNREGDTFFCEIYETRPQICRDYSPGSTELCPLYSKPPAKK